MLQDLFLAMQTGREIRIGNWLYYVTGILREQGYNDEATTWSIKVVPCPGTPEITQIFYDARKRVIIA
jgi:hypothetical protein